MSEAEDEKELSPSKTDPLSTSSFAGGLVGAGGQIGPYKLLKPLGEGSFGIVFLAEQNAPVKRQVALKVIKPVKGRCFLGDLSLCSISAEDDIEFSC